MAVTGKQHFGRFGDKVKQFDVTGKTLLIPSMAPFASRLLAAAFHAVGVDAQIMETYKGLALGKEFTSGKECFPCQVTLGDILYFLRNEKDRLGPAFSPDNWAVPFRHVQQDAAAGFGQVRRVSGCADYLSFDSKRLFHSGNHACGSIFDIPKIVLCNYNYIRYPGSHRMARATIRTSPGVDRFLFGKST
jgi:hypothetical protein